MVNKSNAAVIPAESPAPGYDLEEGVIYGEYAGKEFSIDLDSLLCEAQRIGFIRADGLRFYGSYWYEDLNYPEYRTIQGPATEYWDGMKPEQKEAAIISAISWGWH